MIEKYCMLFVLCFLVYLFCFCIRTTWYPSVSFTVVEILFLTNMAYYIRPSVMEDLRTTFLSLFAPDGVDTKPTRFFIPGVRPGVIPPVVIDLAVIGVYDFLSIASMDDTFPFTRCWSRCAAGDMAGFL